MFGSMGPLHEYLLPAFNLYSLIFGVFGGRMSIYLNLELADFPFPLFPAPTSAPFPSPSFPVGYTILLFL
jgi:hypothetical protein